MAEKDQQVYPMPQPSSSTDAKHDEEANTVQSQELRRKKRMKCLAYVVAFAVFQTAIILLFALTVMKIRTPRFRVRSATFDRLDVGTPTSPSFNLRMNAELGVKNTNFGHYKFDNSTVSFFYRGAQVGSVDVVKARARARSTKKFSIVVDLISATSNNSELGIDLSSGILPLSSQSSLRGKVELFKVMKKKKSTQMNCTMEVNISSRQLQKVVCK
uniref:Late embryogenesis abundant protein LEA-2 subgroup domain-containing protein n=1 Tax=Davidia involucrata TaxID=16924 RepID=A0A5B7AH91_DAVIN